jgi:putative membrane protein
VIAAAFQEQYQMMERRLWYIITWPAAILTLIFGVGMLYLQPAFLGDAWMHVKLGLVALLYAYHYWCHRIFLKMQRNETSYSSLKLRMINEVATLLLFAIVFVVVLKSALGWITAVLGLVVLAALLMIGIRLYRKYKGE